jgi:hypothetical protein
MEQQVVHRRFTSGGVYRQSGEVVEPVGLTDVRLKKMQGQRYLAPYTGKAFECSSSGCDRKFSTPELLEGHTLEAHTKGGQDSNEITTGNDKSPATNRAKPVR